MILVDANLLVYSHISSLPQHRSAADWLNDKLNGKARVGLPWGSLLGFLRLVSNPKIFERAERIEQAWEQVEAWLGCETVWVPCPTERHASILGRLLSNGGIKSDLVPDAHLAALAIEHGLELCSTDGDFARFEGLKWRNPLKNKSF